MDPYPVVKSNSMDLLCGLERSGGPLPYLFLQRVKGIKGNE
jgi:hypothetical protein